MIIKDHWKTVDGWAAFTPLYRYMVEQAEGPAIFVEVGSWLGKSACFMAEQIVESGKAIQFACVDPWLDGGPDLRDTKYYRNLSAPPYELFLRNTLPFAGIIKPFRSTSHDASKLFEDESVDFIMLDGDHSYDAVAADIQDWAPKMKRGAVMSGDDYMWPGVKKAVHEAFGKQVEVTHVKHHQNPLLSASYWQVVMA